MSTVAFRYQHEQVAGNQDGNSREHKSVGPSSQKSPYSHCLSTGLGNAYSLATFCVELVLRRLDHSMEVCAFANQVRMQTRAVCNIRALFYVNVGPESHCCQAERSLSSQAQRCVTIVNTGVEGFPIDGVKGPDGRRAVFESCNPSVLRRSLLSRRDWNAKVKMSHEGVLLEQWRWREAGETWWWHLGPDRLVPKKMVHTTIKGHPGHQGHHPLHVSIGRCVADSCLILPQAHLPWSTIYSICTQFVNLCK
jgi:hypothetical protein